MTKPTDRDLLPEYDFSKGERGKYAARVAKGSNVAVTRRSSPRPKAAARKRAAA
jgi:hypothetical protein